MTCRGLWNCKSSGVTAAATFVSAETEEAAEERRPAEWARAWLGNREASSLWEAPQQAPPASPSLPPPRPRLTPLPRLFNPQPFRRSHG